MRHLMSPLDFSVEELDQLLDLASDIEKHPKKYAHACDGKKLATCFYEPSTRTRLSFEAAMLNLGGSVLVVYPGHVAIYIGNGNIVEAQSTRAGITNSRPVNCHTITAIRRLV